MVRSRSEQLRYQLLQDDPWSPGTKVAADAIALACAMADEQALQADPMRTLALVDALHCTAIGLLSATTDPGEHEEMAARVGELRLRRPASSEAFMPAATPADLQSTASLNA
jgi:hypothetical protein